MYEMGSRLIEYRNRRADRMTPNQLEVNLGGPRKIDGGGGLNEFRKRFERGIVFI